MAIDEKIKQAVLQKAGLEECVVKDINEVSRKSEELVSFLELMVRSPDYFHKLLVDGECSLKYEDEEGCSFHAGAGYADLSFLSGKIIISDEKKGIDIRVTHDLNKGFSTQIFPFNHRNNIIDIYIHGKRGTAQIYMEVGTHIYAIETFDRDTAFVKSNSLFWEDIASAFNMTEIVSAPKNIGYRQIVPWFSFTKPENGNILYMGTTNSEGCTHLNREIKIEFNNPVPVSLLEQWRSTPLEKFIDRKAALAFVNDVFISERNNLPEDGMAKSFRIAMSYNLADKEEIKDLIGYLLKL